MRPLDADHEAYVLSAAEDEESAVPVSRALVRALLAVVLRTGGSGTAEAEAVRIAYRAEPLRPAAGLVLLAVPCARSPRTPECARCGHWKDEHDHPAIASACDRYRLHIGPPRFKVPEHGAVSYAWVRRMGRTRIVFEVGEPCEVFPGGTLTVHRYPDRGDGRAEFGVHRWPIPAERRSWWIARARAHIR